MLASHHPPAAVVVGAFARERDAQVAAGLIAGAPEIDASFHLRAVQGEGGDVQMVLLAVDLPAARYLTRVRAAITGAHGVCVDLPIDAGDPG